MSPAQIEEYEPERTWDEIFDRANNHPSDDGHYQKGVRSLAFGEKVMSERYGKGDYQIKPGSWLRFANLGK
jgi:hypothetical protein